jgi:hypothetical protein
VQPGQPVHRAARSRPTTGLAHQSSPATAYSDPEPGHARTESRGRSPWPFSVANRVAASKHVDCSAPFEKNDSDNADGAHRPPGSEPAAPRSASTDPRNHQSRVRSRDTFTFTSATVTSYRPARACAPSSPSYQGSKRPCQEPSDRPIGSHPTSRLRQVRGFSVRQRSKLAEAEPLTSLVESRALCGTSQPSEVPSAITWPSTLDLPTPGGAVHIIALRSVKTCGCSSRKSARIRA